MKNRVELRSDDSDDGHIAIKFRCYAVEGKAIPATGPFGDFTLARLPIFIRSAEDRAELVRELRSVADTIEAQKGVYQ